MNRVIAFLVLNLLSGVAISAAMSISDIDKTKTTTRSVENSTGEPWKAWGLTQSDWKQYESIMEGPRGVWTPDVSPLTALGAHTQSEHERLRYAKLSAELDYQRTRSEAEWQLVYDAVKNRVWAENRAKETVAVNLDGLRSHHRVVLFTDALCSARCRRVMDSLKNSQVNVDVYFVGEISRDDIVDWAQQQKLPPESVNRTGQYSLNHDNGILKGLGHDETALPLLLMKDSNGLYEVVGL